ncbi:signal transduction histidine kinase [Leptolyngbyaceae cyanobacterium JSC-12]|nr:signal transduction histidine kinase [Leptolyngbyaceae cyanobacterium JSC-12]
MLRSSPAINFTQHQRTFLVLVADDDQAILDLVSQVLVNDGYRILKANDGIQCLEMYQKFHPALVLLDMQMPGMDGLTCCKRISKLSNGSVPILMMSSFSSGELIDRVFAAGAVDYLIKPFHLTVLQHRVQQFLYQIDLEQKIQQLTSDWAYQTQLYQSAQKQIKELEELHQRKDDFLNTACHELRAPLSNIRLAIQMLTYFLTEGKSSSQESGTQNLENCKTAHYLKILETESEREITLLNDLLDLQRLDGGEHPQQTNIMYLDEWLNTLTNSFKEQMQQRQQMLRLQIPPKFPPFVCDTSSLNRILTELLQNACKYTPVGETILVTARMMTGDKAGERESLVLPSLSSASFSQFLQISVTNSGVEIPVEDLPRIFEKFYRVPGSDRYQQGGTGLGLALVQKLVEHMDGSIQVSSSDQQTCFTVTLPFTPVTGCI